MKDGQARKRLEEVESSLDKQYGAICRVRNDVSELMLSYVCVMKRLDGLEGKVSPAVKQAVQTLRDAGWDVDDPEEVEDEA
jgi:tetrahydromethanopterin S-methyltransferase subunit G